MRILGGSLFLYFLWLYPYTLAMMGDWVSVVMWRNAPAGSLFPIPTMPGLLDMLVQANEIDSFIYLYVFKTWLWLIYGAFAVPYALSPYRPSTKPESPAIWDDS